MPRPSIRAIGVLGLCVIGLGACGGKGSSGTSSPSGTSADPLQITGRERIGWTQTTDSVDPLHFGVYIDFTTRADLHASCRPAQSGTFECDSPLPPLSAGPHTLEMVAWIVVSGRDFEGTRAEAIHVVVTTGAATVQQTAPRSTPAPTSPPSSSRAAIGCGLAPRADHDVLMWTDHGDIQVVDRQTRASRPIAWKSVDAQSWTLSGVTAHPQFAQNRTVYMTEVQNNSEGPRIRLSRYRDVADVLGERAVLFEAPLSTPPARTALTVGADRFIHIALLASPESGQATSGREHLFVIRVDENGRVPADNPGASMFDRAMATAPLAVAWNGNAREPWIVEELRPGAYRVKPAMLEARERRAFQSAAPPAAMQPVDKAGTRRLLSVSRNGELVTMDLVDGDWTVRARTPLASGLQTVQDLLAFPDGEVFVCGSTAAGGYGIWRGRPPL